MEGLFAGLDVSTQSCKLVVIDAVRGATVHLDAVRYDEDLPTYGTRNGTIPGLGEGVSESDPLMWIEAVETVLGRLEGSAVDPADIRCISVSGQQHGLVALDHEGGLARPRAKLWNDFSTLEECRILTDHVGGHERMIAEIANSQRTGYTAPKILHMARHEPEVYRATEIFLLVHNYINWYLTGGMAVMEPGDASGTALWDPIGGDWSKKLLQAIPGLEPKLPPVRPTDASIGRISPQLASTFGLSPECRVDAGSGDNMYGAVGTGNVQPGIVTISLGTSGTACTVTEEPFVDPTGEVACYRDSTGAFLPLLCVSNMANGYMDVLDRFDLSHESFDEVVAQAPPGNRGRVLIPWYEGERTPDLPQAAPLYFGFGVDDFTADVLGRAVLEGHVLNLWAGSRRMPLAPERIHLTGGLAQSPAWRQVIADVFEVETVRVSGEGAALGAAIHAAWVWMKEAGMDVSLPGLADTFVPIDETSRCAPDPESVKAHRKQKDLFLALSERIRGLDAPDPFELRARMLHESSKV